MSTARRTIHARIDEAPRARSSMHRRCIGAGRANEGLRADWQLQLRRAIRDCGFEYIRMHGLLSDDMGVVLGIRDDKPILNFQYVDALLDMGIRPFVELGFMPGLLASGPQTIFWWKGNVTLPKRWDWWDHLITSLVSHWTRRYGEDEVARWYFEVWNEPNLNQHGFFEGTQADYFELYAHSARAIKAVSPLFRTGGPATAGNAWVPEFIAWCHGNQVPLDFVSTHHYAVTAGFLDEHGNAGTVLDPTPEAMYREIRQVREEIKQSPLPGLELHYTEWSSSYTPSDPFHDTYQSAAFILDKVTHSEGATDSMSYWTFTDIFEETGPRELPFHGGFGLMNFQGIPKASYFAFAFLKKLGPLQYRTNDAAAMVCRQGDEIQALVWDFTLRPADPPANNQVYYAQDLPPRFASPVDLELKGMERGLWIREITLVGHGNHDALTLYRRMGSPRNLSPSQVRLMQDLCDGRPQRRDTVEVGGDGVFTMNLELRENDVVFISLRPLALGGP